MTNLWSVVSENNIFKEFVKNYKNNKLFHEK